jgi:flagellar motor switch protein FliN/FliY
MTTDHSQAIEHLLSAAVRSAGDVVQERLSRPVQVGASGLPQSGSLLRFDVQFGEDVRLCWFVSDTDATGFADLLSGGTGDRGAVLTEVHLDALSGAFSAMLEQALAAINSYLAAPLVSTNVDMGMESMLPDAAGALQYSCAIDIDGFGPVTIVQHASAPLVEQLANMMRPESAAELAGRAAGTHNDGASPEVQPEPASAHVHHTAHSPHSASPVSNVVPLPHQVHMHERREPGDIRMLMNVPLQVTVELGRTEKSVRQLLDLNVGSIIELAKLAGDPLDIMVNGKVLARGEVVVIDEEFGVRVTEILSPEDRLRKLG